MKKLLLRLIAVMFLLPMYTAGQVANETVDEYLQRMQQKRGKGVGWYGYDKTATAEDIKLVVEYDKFKNVTTAILQHPLNLKIGLGDLNTLLLNVVYSCSGDKLCRPDTVFWDFNAVGSEWRYIKSDRELILLLDGTRISFGQLDWDGDTQPGVRSVQTWERMNLDMPTSVFERILRADSIEGKLGHRTFTFEKEHLLALRNLFQFPPEPEPASKPVAPKKKAARKKP